MKSYKQFINEGFFFNTKSTKSKSKLEILLDDMIESIKEENIYISKKNEIYTTTIDDNTYKIEKVKNSNSDAYYLSINDKNLIDITESYYLKIEKLREHQMSEFTSNFLDLVEKNNLTIIRDKHNTKIYTIDLLDITLIKDFTTVEMRKELIANKPLSRNIIVRFTLKYDNIATLDFGYSDNTNIIKKYHDKVIKLYNKQEESNFPDPSIAGRSAKKYNL